MLTFIKTLFRKPTTSKVAGIEPDASSQSRVLTESAPPVMTARPATEPAAPMPQVAVARLALRPILERLPEDLRAHVLKMPEDSVTVALPISTIQKQLATGCVKMSLASLYRQAPAGTFSAERDEEKRMIELPLSEVLRHVKPQALRRKEQRRVELPEDAPALFSDRLNPYSISPKVGRPIAPTAPDAEDESFAIEVVEPRSEEASAQPGSRPALRMPQEPASTPEPDPVEEVLGNVDLPVSAFTPGWPAEVQEELGHVPEAIFAIPASRLAAGLSTGRVTFSWGELRRWLNPPPVNGTSVGEDQELMLPLKVVAPAFLAHSKPKTARRNVEFDTSIPALFGVDLPSDRPAAEATAESVTEPVEADEAPEDSATPTEEAAPPVEEPSLSTEDEAPKAEAPTMFRLALEEPEPVEMAREERVEMAEEATPDAAPAEVQCEVATPSEHTEEQPAPAAKEPESGTPALADIFGMPGKTSWSPLELVEQIAGMPAVAGAIVALQEGLVVAAKLPPNMKADTVAAFLPQIFARLNTYSEEMSLGPVEDLLLTTHGAQFQAYRMGEVYFAALAVPGESLPWQAVRLIAQELRTQIRN